MNHLGRLMEAMPQNIDCGLVISPVNRRYFTDFPSTAGMLLVTREKAYFLVDFRYYERALQHIKHCEVLLLNNAVEQIPEILQRHGCETIGVESYHMSLFEYQNLCQKYPGFEFEKGVEFEDAILNLRMIKTEEEIQKIIAAQKITESAFFHILGFVKEGVTEKEVSYELQRFMLEHGAEAMAFDPIVVSGRNASSPHGVPTDKRLEEGDFVTMDYGAKKDGYCSDMTRTVMIGEPSREQTMFYKTVLVGQNLGLDSVKAGKKGNEPDHIVRQYFESQGFGDAFGHGLGHGLGLEIHEDAYLNPKSKTVLRPGMVVTVEPGLYLPGKYGVRIEDMVVVTEQGCKNLTHCPKDLICL